MVAQEAGAARPVESPIQQNRPFETEPAGWLRLPTTLTSFLGREREIAGGLDLLARDDVHLLTLTGPGGVGKSRLAIEIAREAAATFPDGVAFVALGTVTDSTLVLPTIARAMGMREVSGFSLEELLARLLAERRILLLLDNFEH